MKTSNECTSYRFDRYINGRLMAEGVVVERAHSLDSATAIAVRLAARGPNGEMPVLVLDSSKSNAVVLK